MGNGSYIGAHSKVFISDRGTSWEVPDRSAKGRSVVSSVAGDQVAHGWCRDFSGGR